MKQAAASGFQAEKYVMQVNLPVIPMLLRCGLIFYYIGKICRKRQCLNIRRYIIETAYRLCTVKRISFTAAADAERCIVEKGCGTRILSAYLLCAVRHNHFQSLSGEQVSRNSILAYNALPDNKPFQRNKH